MSELGVRELELTRKKWDELFAQDTALFDRQDEKQLAAYEFVRNKLDKKDLFLEAGCGKAWMSARLAENGFSVSGIDISEKAVAHARALFKKLGLEGSFEIGDVRRMPYKSSSFDCVYAGGLIEHFEDYSLAVKEMARVLKPNGRLVVTVPVISLSAFTYRQMNGNIPNLPLIKPFFKWLHLRLLGGKHMVYGYELSFTQSQIRKVFEKAGLGVLELKHLDFPLSIKFFKSSAMKKLLRAIERNRLFWAMIYCVGEKR